jgi:hypothetical protein
VLVSAQFLQSMAVSLSAHGGVQLIASSMEKIWDQARGDGRQQLGSGRTFCGHARRRKPMELMFTSVVMADLYREYVDASV